MKMKKVMALALAGAMTASVVPAVPATAAAGDTLVIWTLTNDLISFAEKYEKETGVKCEVEVTQPADYPTKVQAAILAGEKEPDIVVGEPKMLDSYYEAGLLADLDELGASEYEGQIVDYVWKYGKDADGVQRAISWQITPAGIYYRRDIAKEVFGTDDPAEIGQKFQDYNTILETAETLKQAGYKIFASDGEMNVFSNKEAWVVDDTLNVSQARLDFMDLCIELFQNDYTAYATQWTAPWYQAMAGEIPVYDKDTNLWDDAERAEAEANATETTQVFAYGLPAWGVLTMRDNYKDTEGLWGVCAGPSNGFDGGTYIGINTNSEKKELAWDFIKYCTLNDDTLNWWITESKGDTVSKLSVLDAHKDDENETYGGQKLYQFWLEQAEKIDLSIVTPYDQGIGDAWGNAISAVKMEQKSKEEAISDFYDEIEATYPEIIVER
ncbi:MAG: ABC transporter substrate-binding protein [Lachnospiraceae bacterium]|nr:ABC transporter substrate-binding protein [Lachnospiraceae bacterium]